MDVCVGLICWQDGPELMQRCLDSIVPCTDRLLVADGLVQGVPDLGLPPTSGLDAWLHERYPQLEPEIRAEMWPDHSTKLNWLLERSREIGADWLLMLAGDEDLHNPDMLRPFLEHCEGDYWPIPFYYGTFNGVPEEASLCPSKCVRPNNWIRSIAGSNCFEHRNGTIYRVPDHATDGLRADVYYLLTVDKIPWLDHHPELRPDGRRELRFVEYEMNLDPIPSETIEWPEMTLRPHPILGAGFRCEQCGHVSPGASVCTGDRKRDFVHPPAHRVALHPLAKDPGALGYPA